MRLYSTVPRSNQQWSGKMTKRHDLTVKAQIRDVLTGLRGQERVSAKWWCACLAKAGLPVWARFGVFPGPRDMAELRQRFEHSDPELLSAFEASYRISCAEFEARLGKPLQTHLAAPGSLNAASLAR
jgi:hypothetical protein